MRLKSSLVAALDSAISSIGKILNKAKQFVVSKVSKTNKIKNILTSIKQKITSIRSIKDLKSSIQSTYDTLKSKVKLVK